MYVKPSVLCLLALAALLIGAPAWAARSEEVATVHRDPNHLGFQPRVADAGAVLTVTGPNGFLSRRQYSSAAEAAFDVAPDMEDGLYRFELRLLPRIDAATRRALAQARAAGDEGAESRLRAAGKIPAEAQLLSGYFTVQNGSMVDDEIEEAAAEGPSSAPSSAGLDAVSGGSGLGIASAATQVIAMDLIVQGSECVGVDCTSSESFGFDTIRLKENNLRIKFQDTSTGTFPSRDWQLTANDSASGGANRFSIDDIDGGRTPFTIEAAAPSHSLYVDDGGRIGLGTMTPVVEVHVIDGDTPTMRLEQDGSSGFTPLTWDIAGNETNFFVRDVTNGSKLPFKIFPNAPTNSLIVEGTTGDIGVGIASPTATLHVRRSDGTAGIFVEETSGTAENRTLLSMINKGPVAIQFENTEQTNVWQIRRSGSGMAIDNDTNSSDAVFFDTGRVRFRSSGATTTFDLSDTGNLVISGTLTQMSDRSKKTNIQQVSGQEVLDKVMQLPIATWQLLGGEPDVTHMGPMAQDFHALFGLGIDERHIATIDTSGVALAAIQALGQKLQEKQQEIDSLKARLEALEAGLER